MTSLKTCKFFTNGTSNQFEWMLGKYDQCLELKAHNKSNKPENVIKLDKWYQNELPKKIKSRGKEAHLVHEEIVQTIKWKLARGKFRPNLTNMVRMNTPRVVMQETKKAFRKIAKNQDIQSAITSLCTLKGVGPAMASAVLSAGAPELAPYMADECLLSMPDVESLDYTVREYMNLVEFVKGVVERLNAEHGSNYWDPHKVELAVWSHYVANDLKPEMLEEMPAPTKSVTNGESSAENVSSTNGESTNGASAAAPETGANGSSDSTDSTDVELKEDVNGGSDNNDTPTNGSSQKTDETNSNGNSEKVNGKSSSTAEIPSSTDSESTNDSTMNNLEAEDTNTNDSMKENNEASSSSSTTTSTSTKRPLEEVEEPAPAVESSKEVEADDQQPAAKKPKPADEAEAVPETTTPSAPPPAAAAETAA